MSSRRLEEGTNLPSHILQRSNRPDRGCSGRGDRGSPNIKCSTGSETSESRKQSNFSEHCSLGEFQWCKKELSLAAQFEGHWLTFYMHSYRRIPVC